MLAPNIFPSRERRRIDLGCNARRVIVVIEELDLAAQKRPFIVETLDFETPSAGGLDVEPAVLVAFHHSVDHRAAAEIGDALRSTGQHDAEFGLAGDRFTDHFAVARLENVEWQRRARKEHGLQWKEGQKHLLHVTIIPFHG